MASCEVCGGPVSNTYSVCRESQECRREYKRRRCVSALEGRGMSALLEQAAQYQQDEREPPGAISEAWRQKERERRRKRYRKYRENEDAGKRAWRLANLERVRAWERSYRQANREKLQAAGREWYQANREHALSVSNEYRSELRSTIRGTARLMFLGARARARARGLPFDLTAEWVESELAFALENGCPLLGIEITLDRSDGRRPPGTPSIDRFRPELGYTQANCWVISFRANSMKQDASLDFMRRVLEYADTRFAVDPAVETA